MFKKMLLKDGEGNFTSYKVEADNKKYKFWQRNPLAISRVL
jgi:hypothetical protein